MEAELLILEFGLNEVAQGCDTPKDTNFVFDQEVEVFEEEGSLIICNFVSYGTSNQFPYDLVTFSFTFSEKSSEMKTGMLAGLYVPDPGGDISIVSSGPVHV